jgi:HEAT repeat protein
VTRLLAATKPLWRGAPKDWSVTRFRDVGTSHGPPIFSPAYALAAVHDPAKLGEVVRTGTHDDRAYALTKLIALNDPASAPVRAAAVGALGRIGGAAARDGIATALGDSDRQVRRCARHARRHLRAQG